MKKPLNLKNKKIGNNVTKVERKMIFDGLLFLKKFNKDLDHMETDYSLFFHISGGRVVSFDLATWCII